MLLSDVVLTAHAGIVKSPMKQDGETAWSDVMHGNRYVFGS